MAMSETTEKPELLPADEPTQEQLAEIEKEEAEPKEEADPDAFAPELNAISIYLHSLRRNPLLTIEEEIELSKEIDPFRAEYMAIFNEIEKVRMHVEDRAEQPAQAEIDQLELLRRELAKYDSDKIFNQAVNRLVVGNLRLVVSIAKRHMLYLPLLECISTGNLGLRKAAIKFDWKRGNKFATYAAWWIRQAIWREISDRRATIRIPIDHMEILRKIGKAVSRLNSKGNLDPTDEDIAAEINLMRAEKKEADLEAGLDEPKNPVKPITAKRIKYIREKGRLLRCVELNRPLGREDDDDSDELMDSTSDTGTEGKDHTRSQDAGLIAETARKITDRMLGALDPRAEKIMRERFSKGKTLEAVGKRLGLTRERVRQIQKKTVEKLRARAEAIYNGEDERKGR